MVVRAANGRAALRLRCDGEMRMEAGARLGDYEIGAPLGAGGMGEVYRAVDLKLRREVAIKVLPEGLARDRERLQRFEREARTLAGLNHPNIATLYGFESAGDTSFLVMELISGQDLSEVVDSGPMAVQNAVPLFLQIAEGLEAAHAAGVVHRDLKPANVKIAPDGRVKILDFGLAKDLHALAPEEGLSDSPTLTVAATRHGEILGTAAYMAPEQAAGRRVDERADVWAFGACLFEALTGERAFPAESAAETLARVLEREPDWELLPSGLPWLLERLLRRCLVKDEKDRVHSMADVRLELKECLAGVSPPEPVASGRQSLGPWSWLVAAGVGAVLSAVTLNLLVTSPAPDVGVRATLDAPPSEAIQVLGVTAHKVVQK